MFSKSLQPHLHYQINSVVRVQIGWEKLDGVVTEINQADIVVKVGENDFRWVEFNQVLAVMEF